jgi:16S rRNA (guanine966-N2)-methyltransferase
MVTRPTSDKIKETLFNILAPHLYDVNFLDLFAGSGGIGIEALSRGARHCTFIDNSKESANAIKKNLETTHFTEVSRVMCENVSTAVYNIRSNEPFDIVFMDPPYDKGFESPVLAALKNSGILADDALIVAEADIDTDFSFADELGYDIVRVKSYKNNKHVFLRIGQSADMEESG